MSARVFGRTPLDLAFARDQTGVLLAVAFALASYLAAMGGLALVLLADDARAWNRSLGLSLTLQVPVETSAPRLEMALALLRQTAGIAGVRPLESAETARLLEPWLGSAATADTLPIPRLVDVQTEPGANIDVAELRQKLASIAPGAQLDDHRALADEHRRAGMRLTILIAIGLAAAVALAAALTLLLTGLRLATHRGVIELLHLIGAEDAAIARTVQIDALFAGLAGAGAGAAAALLTLFAIGSAMPLDASASAADWRLWAVAIAVTAILSAGAMSVARFAVLRRLAHMP
jgi:cell division transport system permease protein